MVRRLLLFGVPVIVSLFGIGSPGRASADLAKDAAPEAKPGARLREILTDPALWGKDGPLAVAYLVGWSRLGEGRVEILPDVILGATPYEKRESARQAALRLSVMVKAPLPPLHPALAARLGGAAPRQGPLLSAQLIPHLTEDDSARVALTAAAAEFIPPGLTMATVQERLGAPEAISSAFIQNRSDTRPVILKLHSYADGAVVFAESNYAARPGLVDRIIVDVAAAAAALVKEEK